MFIRYLAVCASFIYPLVCFSYHIQQAITLHGAQEMEVVRNVAFEILGHSIYLEDGTETNNLIQENLVFTTREGFVDRTMHGDDAQDDTPASYWISNPQNRKWCI